LVLVIDRFVQTGPVEFLAEQVEQTVG